MSINSSKVYCKLTSQIFRYAMKLVLIVAKCIVNHVLMKGVGYYGKVLIVAKCIVNLCYFTRGAFLFLVLIVAKCIVNDLLKVNKNKIEKVLIVAKCIVNWFKSGRISGDYKY